MSAVVFIPLLALTWALGFVLAMVAAHYFLAVIDSSAAGSREIVWPNEPFTEWFGQLFYLAWIGGSWMAPLVILSRLTTPDPMWRFVVMVGSFWLLFPIGMLSSRSASSPFIPFLPALIGRMGQRIIAVLGFYLVSFPIALAFGWAWYSILMGQDNSMGRILVSAPIAVAAFLIYGRALGRLGLVLTFTKGGENESGGRRRKKKKNKGKQKEEAVVERPAFVQPSELPPIETPFEGPVTGYDVVFEDRPAAVPVLEKHSRGNLDDGEDLTPFGMEVESSDGEPVVKPPIPQPTEAELALWDTSERVKEPKRVWDSSLFSFLLEPRTATSWLVLTAGLAFLGSLLNLMRELRPT